MAEREDLINNERDWSDLLADIVHLIAKKLPDLLEFVRFRAVCKSWRSSAPLSDPPPQMPWLLEISGWTSNSEQLSTTELRFYSIISGKTVTVPVKQYVWFRGALCHCLPSYDDLKDIISLYNPLTQKEIVYPFIHTIPHLMSMPWMGWTGTSPICDRNILIVDCDGFPNEVGRWAFYDAQKETWTDDEGFFYNFCYCKGKLFSIYGNFTTKVIDISSKKKLYAIPPPEEGNEGFMWLRWPFLVESSGEILLVSWLQKRENYNETIEDPKFHIHRLDFGEEDRQPCWIRISDIGDRIIFLQMRNSFSMTAAPSNTGFKGGCIYFTKNDRELYVHHVVTGTVERVPCPFKMCTWFLPSLN